MKISVNRRADIDRSLRRWLRTHHSLITRTEALRVGATDDHIQTRIRRGEWEVVFRGIYRDAATPRTPDQRLLAACLATGPYAVASHRSAAWLWGLIDQPPPAPEVTVPRGDQHGRRVRGVVAHQSADLDPSRTIVRRAIACTDALRTVVDLGAVVATRTLADAVDRALATRLVSVTGLLAEVGLVARQGRNGTRATRGLLTDRGLLGGPAPSVLESRMKRLFDRYNLPSPHFEVVAGVHGEYRLDAAYPALRFAVEVDGYAWHSSPEHLQRDHSRRNRLQSQGWFILVYTWQDVVNDPARVAREVAGLHARLSAAAQA